MDLGILRDCHDFDGRSDRWVSFRTELLRNCIPGLPVRFDTLIFQGSLCLSDQVRPSTPIQEAGSGSLWGAAVCWSAKAQCAQSTKPHKIFDLLRLEILCHEGRRDRFWLCLQLLAFYSGPTAANLKPQALNLRIVKVQSRSLGFPASVL